jgi:hypothetical protein
MCETSWPRPPRRGRPSAEIGDKRATDQEMKRELLERAQELTAEVYRYADLLVGAGLAGSVKPGGSKDPN